MAACDISSYVEVSPHISGLFTNTGQDEELDQPSFSSVSLNNMYGNSKNIFLYYYDNGMYTDVTFKVKCGDSYILFSCHKLILSMRSSVFASYFEGNNVIGQEVEISDVPPSAFEALIKYCYDSTEKLRELRTDVNFLLKVFKAAQKYEIKSLEVSCCDLFSTATPNIYNVFELLDAAVLTGSECLRLRCYKVLQSQTAKILSSRDASSVTPAVINTILDMPTLSLNSEYDLIDWLFEWGSYMCVKSGENENSEHFLRMMAPYFSRINITSLTPKEFGLLAQKYKNYFNPTDGYAIFMNIVLPGSVDLPPWCMGSETKRQFHCGELEFASLSLSLS